MVARTETAEQRLSIYEGLSAHNRRIAVLRVGIPALGLVVFLLLIGQIYIANLSRDLGFGGMSIDRTMAMVQAPRYSGVMADGTAYNVTAGEARASLSATDKIELADTTIVFTNADGSHTKAQTRKALLDTKTQNVEVAGTGDVFGGDGTIGKFFNTLIDWPGQTFNSTGGAKLHFADGTTLDAKQAHYDLEKSVWTFSNVTVKMPSTPGEETATSPAGETP